MTRAKLITDENSPDAEAALVAATAELPPPGTARREVLAERQESLEAQAERIAAQMLLNRIDPATLKIAREIAQRVELLDISHKQPGRAYQWVSRNQNGRHIQKARQLGFQMVQGNDPEADELKGEGGDTTRALGDTMLMWMPEERWVVLKALEIKRQREVEGASASGLIYAASRYPSIVGVSPFHMDSLEGAQVRPVRFSLNQARAWLQRQAQK